MFGYVTINKPELKIKDFDTYKSYYCGLCYILRNKYGIAGQITLTYDMTFLCILLSSLYEAPITGKTKRCIVHPIQKHRLLYTKYTDYVADMNVLLAGYKALDDWKDEHNPLKYAFFKLLKNKPKYAKKSERILSLLTKLDIHEKENETNIDIMAGIFGKIVSEIFAPHNDIWMPHLQKIGFFLGKFIYILDAYDDFEKDMKKNNYNPLKSICKETDFDDKIHSMLTMMMAECCREFEMLPILRDADILRNILYAGVFCSYYRIRERRTQPSSENKTEKEKRKNNNE